MSSLCRAADVSRNTLYRYYPDMAETIRQLRRRRGARRHGALQRAIAALRANLTTTRRQLAQLAAVVDHYYTATEELRAQLARRERDLAALRARARPTLVSIHRPPPSARGS